MMKVAKITLWDGKIFYTSNLDSDRLSLFFEKAKNKYIIENRDISAQAQIDIIDMAEDKYHEIPATCEAAELFAE